MFITPLTQLVFAPEWRIYGLQKGGKCDKMQTNERKDDRRVGELL